MAAQALFWFVHAKPKDRPSIGLAVAAFTERSARVQARKRLGKDATIEAVNPVTYGHAWFIDFGVIQPR